VIEKYEKTAMQWLQNQTKNKIDNDVKEKYKTSPPDSVFDRRLGGKRNVTFLLTRAS